MPLHYPDGRLQLSAWQTLVGRRSPLGGLATLGAARRRCVRGVSLGVAADVPFEQPGSELVAQQNRAGLALGEGDEVILFGRREHAVKDIVGRSEPLLPELSPVLA